MRLCYENNEAFLGCLDYAGYQSYKCSDGSYSICVPWLTWLLIIKWTFWLSRLLSLLIYILQGAQCSWRRQPILSQSSNSPHCMKPEGSLPSAQVPVTCPYSQPDQSSPSPPPAPQYNFLHIHLHIKLPSIPGSYKWFLSLSFLQQNPVWTSSLLHTCHMPRPSHSSWFDHPNNIWWGVQIIKLLLMQFPPLACYLFLRKTKHSPLHPILKHPQPTFLPHCERPCFTPIQNNNQNRLPWLPKYKCRYGPCSLVFQGYQFSLLWAGTQRRHKCLSLRTSPAVLLLQSQSSQDATLILVDASPSSNSLTYTSKRCQKDQFLWHRRYFFFSCGAAPNAGHGLLILEVSRSHTTTHHSR